MRLPKPPRGPNAKSRAACCTCRSAKAMVRRVIRIRGCVARGGLQSCSQVPEGDFRRDRYSPYTADNNRRIGGTGRRHHSPCRPGIQFRSARDRSTRRTSRTGALDGLGRNRGQALQRAERPHTAGAARTRQFKTARSGSGGPDTHFGVGNSMGVPVLSRWRAAHSACVRSTFFESTAHLRCCRVCHRHLYRR